MNKLKKGNVFSRDVILLLAASFFYMASPMLVTPLVTGFSESLGAGAWVMGIVGGLTNLCSLCFQPFSGGIADKVSKYKLGCIGVSFLIVACAGYVISQNPAMILLFRVVNGIGFAFCSVCFSTWIANVLPQERIGFGMGLYGMMNALAMAISPAIGVAVYHRFGYRVAFVFATAFAVICILIIQFCKDKGEPIEKKKPEQKAGEGTLDGERQNVKKSSRFQLIEPRVIPLALVIMCFAIPYCATQSFIVRYSETRGLDITVSLFFTIYAIALLATRFLMSNLFDRGTFVPFLIGGSVCALLALTCLTFMTNNIMMALGSIFMAGGYGLMCTVCQSAAVTCVEPEKRGLANGTYYIGLNSGMAFGPMIGGMLYGNAPIEFYYPILMITVPLGLVLYFGTRMLQRGRK